LVADTHTLILHGLAVVAITITIRFGLAAVITHMIPPGLAAVIQLIPLAADTHQLTQLAVATAETAAVMAVVTAAVTVATAADTAADTKIN
jgi:hypothetical protein